MPPKPTSSKTDHPVKPESSMSPDPLGGELERLRDILIGSHARTVSERLDHLEARSTEMFDELKEEIKNTRQELINTFNSEIAALRKELQEHAKRSQDGLQEYVQRSQAELHEHAQRSQKELQDHAARSQTEQQATNDRLQKLAIENQKLADEQSANLRAAQTDLQEKIEGHARDITARMDQKDDAISQELRQLAATLEEKKVARDELAQLLQDLAQRLGKSKS
ncbi:MAG: hypothetical protein AAB571_10320 [Chloroflexota bacterium]